MVSAVLIVKIHLVCVFFFLHIFTGWMIKQLWRRNVGFSPLHKFFTLSLYVCERHRSSLVSFADGRRASSVRLFVLCQSVYEGIPPAVTGSGIERGAAAETVDARP